MKKLSLVFCGIILSINGFCAEQLFPAFADLDQTVLIKRNSTIKVNEDGTFRLNDRNRYLIGTIYYAGLKMGYAPTSGYPDSLKWLYEQPLNFKSAQRLGFDSMGVTVPNIWTKKYLPRMETSFWYASEIAAMKKFIRNIDEPLYVDYTCAPWAHGLLGKANNRGKLPAEMFNQGTVNQGGNHWTPYSMTNAKGRQLYLEMWRSGAEFVIQAGGKPFIYELFNEPGYNDWSRSSRDLFVQRMQNKYQTIANLNRAWQTNYSSWATVGKFKQQIDNHALYVEWGKFMEEVFVEMCQAGIETIRTIDDNAKVMFGVQPMAFRVVAKYNINVYKLAQFMSYICTSTGGGNFLEMLMLRSIADGKPIVDSETYVGKTSNSLRDKLWLQFARGINASYIFKWDKRAWDRDWGQKKSAAGGRKMTEKFPYLLLNPYGVPTKALTGIMQAKKETLAVADLFAPRERGLASDVALLFSYPTERLSQVAGTPNHNYIMDYAKALLYSHFSIEVLFEEQLALRASKYKIIIASGIDATYDKTPEYLEQYVKNGGILLLGLETLQLNEYGFKRRENRFPGLLPSKRLPQKMGTLTYQTVNVDAVPYRQVNVGRGWKVIADNGNMPAIFEKSYGAGKIIYINSITSAENLGKLLTQLLAKNKVKPFCLTLDARSGKPVFNIEVYGAVNDNYAGFAIFNQSLTAQVINFKPMLKKTYSWSRPFSGEIMTEGVVLYLPPKARVVIIGGRLEDLQKRFGPMKLVDFQSNKAAAFRQLATYKKNQTITNKDKFTINRSQVKTIDLRKFANRGFIDKVANDGKGGWTDQGENSLHGLDWGIQDFAGVPFQIIRFDHNEKKTCIVLGSQKMTALPQAVKRIPIETKAKALYFLHTTAWTSVEVGFKYIVHYADGSKVEIPIKGGVQVGDWWKLKKPSSSNAKIAWKNSRGRGLYAFQWLNPAVNKNIVSLDIVSSNGKTIPIVIAITAELPSKSLKLLNLTKFNFKLFRWGNLDAKIKDKVLELNLTEKSANWCGVKIDLLKSVDITQYKQLAFEINGGENIWGKHGGEQKLQLKIIGSTATGNSVQSKKPVQMQKYIAGGVIDDNKSTYQSVQIPLDRLIGKSKLVKLKELNIQFKKLRQERCGIKIKNIRLQ